MGTFIAVFVLFSLALAGIGLGYLVKGRALKGTCASQAACASLMPCMLWPPSPSSFTVVGEANRASLTVSIAR